MSLVLLAFECERDGRLQVDDHLVHVPAKLACAAGRDADDVRLVRKAEVVDVHPVIGNRQGGGLPFQEPGHSGGLARARRPESVDVVAIASDADAEIDRRDGACLPDDLDELGKVRGGGERRARKSRRLGTPAPPLVPALRGRASGHRGVGPSCPPRIARCGVHEPYPIGAPVQARPPLILLRARDAGPPGRRPRSPVRCRQAGARRRAARVCGLHLWARPGS